MSASPTSSAAAPTKSGSSPIPRRLALYGITLEQLIDKLTNANRSFLVGAFEQIDANVPVVAGQTLQGVPDIGLLLFTARDGRPVYVKDVANVVVGAGRARRSRLDADARRLGRARRSARPSASPSPSARAPTPCMVADRSAPSADGPGAPRAGRPHGRGDPQLRRDRDREGERAVLPSRAGDRLDRRPDHACDRLARGRRRAHRHPDHHPADAVRLLADGLHHQPRQPVRADLLDRHPGRRRHRRDREHRAPLA